MNIDWVLRHYLHKFRKNPNWSFKKIKDDFREKYWILLKHWLYYRARDIALVRLKGFLTEHYGRLRPFILEENSRHQHCICETLTRGRKIF